MTGTIKRVNADEEVAAATNLFALLADPLATTGINMSAVSCTCVGTSGNTVPLVTDWLRQEFRTTCVRAAHPGGDVEDWRLDAAFFGGRGVLALAGTGSNVAARTAGGDIFTAGGWGPILADQGSGHRIGIEDFAARVSWRATKGGPPGSSKRHAGCGTCPKLMLSSSLPIPSLRRGTVLNSRVKSWRARTKAIRWRRRFLTRAA